MRRGHHGMRGWRNENHRHFRPRGGGTPHFRPPRGFGFPEGPRFSRPLGRPSFNPHAGPGDDNLSQDHHERNNYRSDRPHMPIRHVIPPPYGQSRQIFPLLQQMRAGKDMYNDPMYHNENEHCHMNSMGDVDLRHPPQEPFPLHTSPWTHPPPSFIGELNRKPYRHHDNVEQSKLPATNYTGHRPPASDHYGGNHRSANDNSNSFNRSVDDTVDIVRKRLQNRDSLPPSENTLMQSNEEQSSSQESIPQFSAASHDQTTKKKSNRQKTEKSNCDQIKNKIVNQLFRMDKTKINKLMDNPNSSTKFEFAISSLVTESQNSYNQHLRSLAEKSLSSTTDFMHNHNNTIYEDTFIKQMQCILDPQDTVLLEDIKPIVLAEICKVLQLSDLDVDEQQIYSRDEQPNIDQFPGDNYDNYPSYDSSQDSYYNQSSVPNYDGTENRNYSHEYEKKYSNEDQFESNSLFQRRHSRISSDFSDRRRPSIDGQYRRNERQSVDKNLIDERFNRSRTPFCESGSQRSKSPLRESSEDRFRSRMPSTHSNEDNSRKNQQLLKEDTLNVSEPVPLFNPNDDRFASDEEDPFAELDRQYHVAVDHNFIAADDFSQSPSTNRSLTPVSTKDTENHLISVPSFSNSGCDKKSLYQIKPPRINTDIQWIKKEIDDQIQDITKSPIKYCSSEVIEDSKTKKQNETTPTKKNDIEVQQELMEFNQTIVTPSKSVEKKALVTTEEKTPDDKSTHDTPEKLRVQDNLEKAAASSHSRKRSIDQKPSHRKEKRKKSESSHTESNKQILNKNIIINVNDCAAKLEKCDAPKSIFNLFFSKEKSDKEVSKESKKVEGNDKVYSDKYVKRKETPKKKDESDSKKSNSVSSSHSTLSPTDNTSSSTVQTPKSDIKIKLKPIDMFTEQPRKPSSLHQAHRNTAPAPVKTPVEVKRPVIHLTGRKLAKRHIATQVVRKCASKESQTEVGSATTTRFVQTERKKLITRSVQTMPVTFKSDLKGSSQSTDAFERMKEIDLEIQMLLQEKFKLYSSLESKETCSNTMQSLGMAVLNMNPIDETKESEDSYSLSGDDIVDEFTSIPVEELEQIALETVEEQRDSANTEKRSKRLKNRNNRTDRKKSASPMKMTSSSNRKKAKTPNISLIEQIITDDRPLEDIISLDDFEDPLIRSRSKKKGKQQLVKQKHKVAKAPKNAVINTVENVVPDCIKECRVLLIRCDFSKYLNQYSKVEEPEVCEVEVSPQIVDDSAVVVEETVDQDIQFDMLDVSEDIVIGNMCEVKYGEEKDDGGSNISEEIILDNSQLSLEYTAHDAGSGGECKMFDFSADESLRRDTVTVTGNADAVIALECVHNDFIAACLDGNVYHFSGDGQLINTLRGSNLAVTCLTIVKEKCGITVYTGSLDSRIRYYDLETGLEKGPECNVLSPIQTMDRAWDTVFVGTRTGFVLQFECKNNMLIPVSTVKFSEQSILALRAIKEGPRKVLLVAARSEAVTIKDAQTGLLLRTLEGPKMTVYTLLFEDGKVYCGTSSHLIHAFDYASGSHVGTHEGGKGAVCLRAAGGLLFAGCYDGCVYVYRDGDGRPFAQLRGPGLMLLSLAVVGTKVIAGYKDRGLYIWKIPLSVMQEMIL